MSEGFRYSAHRVVVFLHFMTFIITIYWLGSRVIIAATPGFPQLLTSIFVSITTIHFNIWRSTAEITTQRWNFVAMHWSEFIQWKVVDTALWVGNFYCLTYKRRSMNSVDEQNKFTHLKTVFEYVKQHAHKIGSFFR